MERNIIRGGVPLSLSFSLCSARPLGGCVEVAGEAHPPRDERPNLRHVCPRAAPRLRNCVA